MKKFVLLLFVSFWNLRNKRIAVSEGISCDAHRSTLAELLIVILLLINCKLHHSKNWNTLTNMVLLEHEMSTYFSRFE